MRMLAYEFDIATLLFLRRKVLKNFPLKNFEPGPSAALKDMVLAKTEYILHETDCILIRHTVLFRKNLTPLLWPHNGLNRIEPSMYKKTVKEVLAFLLHQFSRKFYILFSLVSITVKDTF